MLNFKKYLTDKAGLSETQFKEIQSFIEVKKVEKRKLFTATGRSLQ